MTTESFTGPMNRIVALVGESPQHVWFVNQLHAEFGLALVVMQRCPRRGLRKLWSRWRTSRAMGSFDAMKGLAVPRVPNRRRAEICDKTFGETWRRIDPQIPLLRVSDINADAVRERLLVEKPDLLIDHGTSLVKRPVLDTAPLALNLHWGLSPYYRGTHCTEWALVDQDPFNIGVTIHRLARRIDGGDIVLQVRADLRPGDTVDDIDMRLTFLGTTALQSVIAGVRSGDSLRFHAQDFALGRLTLNRHWSRDLRRHVRRLVEVDGIARMLERPSRRERLPIVE